MWSRQTVSAPALVLLCLSGCALGQSDLAISPAKIEFRMVAGGQLPIAQPISVTSRQGVGVLDWKASADKASKEWLLPSPVSGSTPGTIQVSLKPTWAASRGPGELAATINVTSSATQPVAVPVAVIVVPKVPPPTFSYIAGPNGCTEVDGFPDPATCIVPEERPPGSFAPPATGGTYADPNFGATVRLLTDAGCLHQYSTPSAISATNKYVLTSCGIRELATGKVVFSDKPSDWNAGTFCDANDDDVLYYLSGAKVMKRSLRANKVATLVDYSRERGFTSISKGGTGDTSKDNWVSFWAPNEKHVCALDLARVKTYCADFSNMPGLPVKRIDFTLIAKGVDRQSGKRYVILVDTAAIAVFSVNLAGDKLDFEYRGPEDVERGGNNDGNCDPGETCFASFHMDTFEDSAGLQHLVFNQETFAPCEYALKTAELNRGLDMRFQSELGGGKRTVMAVFKCGVGTWTDDHVGCAKKAPYCVISTSYARGRDPADMTPIARGPHMSEIFVMRDNGAEIRRLMQNRSILYKTEEGGGYWSYPRASISNDGAWVVGNSNFGTANAHRVFAVSTGFGKVKATSNVVNAASFQPKVAPGVIATLFGESLANCTAQAEGFPLPGTLCGSSVLFGGQPGLFYYASPEQLNFILPSSVPPGEDVTVELRREGAPENDSLVVPASTMDVVAPAAFQYVLEDLVPRAVVQNSDWSLNGPSGPGMRPLRLGEWAALWANGFGGTSPEIRDGEPAPADPLAWTWRPVEVYVNDVPQKVLFSGLAPFYSGLYQVNFELKPETPILAENRVWLKVAEVESPHLLISLSP